MKGILRTIVLFYSWVSLQRWLAAIGLVLIAFAHLRFLAVPADRGLLPNLVLVLGLMFIAMPVVLAGGVMSRAIAAPRTLRFIPYARLRLLLALLITALALAVFLTANIALVKIEAPAAGLARAGLTAVFLGALGGETVLMLWLSAVSSSPYTGLLVFVPIIGQRLAGPLVRYSTMLTRMSVSSLSLLLIIGAWSVFALWYLRARRIAPPLWGDASRASAGRSAQRDARIAITRETAITVQLLGLSSVTRVAWRGFLMTTFVMLVLTLTTFRRPDGTLTPNAGDLFFVAVWAIAFPTMLVAWGIVRRSRFLWIQSGYTREELFRLCEQLSWRCFGAIGVPILALCSAAWILLPHVAGDWKYFLAAALAPAVCALYLGLMNVHGWRVIDITIAVLIVLVGLGSVLVSMNSVRPFPAVLVWIPVVELLGALALRSVARRRWRRIDWLICKPQRMSSQALRPVV